MKDDTTKYPPKKRLKTDKHKMPKSNQEEIRYIINKPIKHTLT